MKWTTTISPMLSGHGIQMTKTMIVLKKQNEAKLTDRIVIPRKISSILLSSGTMSGL